MVGRLDLQQFLSYFFTFVLCQKEFPINVFVEKGHSTKVLEKATEECVNNINCGKERENRDNNEKL